MTFAHNADLFATDMNPLLPDEGIKAHHIAGLLGIDLRAAAKKLATLVEVAYLKKTDSSTWAKTDDFRSAPERERIRSVFELRAKYGWPRMPVIEYWKRVQMLLPEVFDVETLRKITKYRNHASAALLATTAAKEGYVEEVEGERVPTWRQTEKSLKLPNPPDAHMHLCAPTHLVDGVLVTEDRTLKSNATLLAEQQELVRSLRLDNFNQKQRCDQLMRDIGALMARVEDLNKANDYLLRTINNLLEANDALGKSEARMKFHIAFAQLRNIVGTKQTS